jgi:outer membrane protein assembly factor BamA
MRSLAGAALVGALVALAATRATAQAPAPAAPDPASPPVETMDVMDLIRKLRNKEAPPGPFDYTKRMRAIAPVIGGKPSSGVIVGVAGNIAFFRGDPTTTHISSSIVSATVTSKGQAGLGARTTMFGRDDRWRAEVDYRFQWTSLDTLGLGVASADAEAQLARFNFFRLYQSGFVLVRPNLFVGGGLHFDSHVDVRPDEGAEDAWSDSPFVRYSTANGLPLDTQMSAGPSVEVIWDSRDNFINASRGNVARASYRAMFDGFLGGDTRWDKVTVDLRTYKPVSTSGGHTLAGWAYADLVVSGVAPYFDLPATASDGYGRSGRGYSEGHFRGEKLAFFEVEYRGPITKNGLVGWVAFANATTVSNQQAGERIFDHFAPGGGAGLRLLLNKRSKTNLAFDVGFGERRSRGIYLAIQEAF